MAENPWERTEFIERAKFGRCYVLRISPGSNLIERIRALAALKDCRRAAILSGIGAVGNVTLRNLKEGAEMPINKDKVADTTFTGPFEMMSLEGNIVPMAGKPVIHLHAVLGREDGTLIGGHLFDATVFTTVELVLAEMTDSMVVKSRDELTGMAEMTIAE